MLVNKDLKIIVAEKEKIQLFSKSGPAQFAPEKPTPLTTTQSALEQPVPTPAVDLKVVAYYLQKQNTAIQAADPNKEQGQAAFSMVIRRLEQANERIPAEHPQLKILLAHAAGSPDSPTLKERMNTLHSDFIQFYSAKDAGISNDRSKQPGAVHSSIDSSSYPEPAALSANNTLAADSQSVNTPPISKRSDLTPATPVPAQPKPRPEVKT